MSKTTKNASAAAGLRPDIAPMAGPMADPGGVIDLLAGYALPRMSESELAWLALGSLDVSQSLENVVDALSEMADDLCCSSPGHVPQTGVKASYWPMLDQLRTLVAMSGVIHSATRHLLEPNKHRAAAAAPATANQIGGGQ